MDLKVAAAEMLASPSTLLAYMGHSTPISPLSKNLSLLGVVEWSQRREEPPGTGLFFSCGCFTTELDSGNEVTHLIESAVIPFGAAAN